MSNHPESPRPSAASRHRAAAMATAAVVGLAIAWLTSCNDSPNLDGPALVDSLTITDSLETFREPPELLSVGGVLGLALNAGPATFTIGNQQVRANVYDGRYIPCGGW